MVTTLIIFIITIITMILCILFFPKIKIGKISVDTYWLVTLLAAIILLVLNLVKFDNVINYLLEDNAINPLKILVLFISMTMLSIFLDELGFFRFLANYTLKKANNGKNNNQIKLFIYLFITVSILTVFTSNDIIILSFTPFICYFAKNAKISPIPYLTCEFVCANTWSLALVIGNPTNIYLSTAYGLDFLSYLKISIIPTMFAGAISFIMLFIMYHKKLKEKLSNKVEEVKIDNKLLLWIGIAHLIICTILLAISSYIHLEMWLISLLSVISLFIFSMIAAIIQKRKPKELFSSLKRAPYQLIPFILSMFVIIIALTEQQITTRIANLFTGSYPIIKYGVLSFLTSNIINNIPMSVLFSSIIEINKAGIGAVFATIIGSNIGAFLTPIGALAGIMWSSILNKHGHKFKYFDFLKMGLLVAIPSLAFALFGLWLSLLI